MINILWPWVFVLLPLPFLLRWLLPAAKTVDDAALRVSYLEDFLHNYSNKFAIHARRWSLWLACLAWLLLIAAASRPQWIGQAIELPVSGRDLMLAVDLSGSMEAEDFKIGNQFVNRLIATQQVAGEFIERRVGDRLGLILFGKQAYLQTPLTFDRETVRTLLDEAVIGLAGKETAIGDAIGLGVKRLRENPVESRILILLTDGANTAGEIEPIKAAELAAAEGLKIYTIGIGADEMIVQSFFGARRINPSADLDEKTLKAIAEKTGGKYFRARDTQEMESIYSIIDQIEPVDQEKQVFRPHHALFQWPLGFALAIVSLMILGRGVGWMA